MTGTGPGAASRESRDDGRDAFTVTGGAGGTKACLVALVNGAIRAERAAEHLAEAERLAGVAAGTLAATRAASPDTAARAAASVREVTNRAAGVPRAADSLRHLAAGLRGTAETFARADHLSALLLRVPVALAQALGEAVPGGALTLGVLGATGLVVSAQATLSARLLRYTPTPLGLTLRWLGSDARRDDGGLTGVVARLVGGPGLVPEITFPNPRQLEAVLPALAAFLMGTVPGRTPALRQPVADAAALMALAGPAFAGLLGRPVPALVVAPLVSGKGAKGAEGVRPRTVVDLLRQVESVAHEVDGAVGVQSLEHRDGTRTWVVSVPGTQDSGFGGPTTTDMTSNVELVGGVPSDRTETVVEAMRQAGIPPDEEVLLVGHSQGGMAAVTAAATVGEEFTVAGVLTAGSPVGGMVLPDDVPALHVEHAQDYVPAADGTPNPDELNRTTVVRDLAVPVDGATPLAAGSLRDVFSEPHELTTYIETVELLGAVDDRSVAGFVESIEHLLDDGTARVTTQLFVGVRVPDDARATSSS